jgi:hypothetical protein
MYKLMHAFLLWNAKYIPSFTRGFSKFVYCLVVFEGAKIIKQIRLIYPMSFFFYQFYKIKLQSWQSLTFTGLPTVIFAGNGGV